MARQKTIPFPIVNIAMAVMSAASNSPSPSALELASRTHRSIFFGYMCWLVLAAVATLFFTWTLWKSSNRRQDAARGEADERATRLETAASDAKTKQIEAEKSLLALQHLIKQPRTVDWKKAKEILGAGPKGSVKILYTDGSQEAFNLASSLHGVLTSSGWAASGPDWAVGGIPFTGILIEVGGEGWPTEHPNDPMEDGPEPARTLRIMLSKAVNDNRGVGMNAKNQRPAEDPLVLMIGPKY